MVCREPICIFAMLSSSCWPRNIMSNHWNVDYKLNCHTPYRGARSSPSLTPLLCLVQISGLNTVQGGRRGCMPGTPLTSAPQANGQRRPGIGRSLGSCVHTLLLTGKNSWLYAQIVNCCIKKGVVTYSFPRSSREQGRNCGSGLLLGQCSYTLPLTQADG